MLVRFAPLALATCLALASGADAQDLDATGVPRHGTLQLSDGQQDALDIILTPEAPVPAEDCPGYIAPGDPDATIDWNGDGPLRIWLRSASDGVLVVRAPLGETLCNDDADGVQPAIEFGQAQPGSYAVWAGTFSPSIDASTAATLYAGTPPEAVSFQSADASTPSVVYTGETPSGETTAVIAGGGYTASSLGMGEGCVGFYDAMPTIRVSAPAPYVLTTDSDADLVLAVLTPEGEWLCNDDGGEGANPLVEIGSTDQHTVWVGTFRGFARGDAPEADLVVTDEAPSDRIVPLPPTPANRTPFSDGSYTPLDLSASGEAFRLEDSADDVAIEVPVAGEFSNPVSGMMCNGTLSAQATATLTVEGDGPISITASGGEANLVMVARTDDDRWFCSDDASGRDPAVEIEDAETIMLWVGTYSIGEAMASIEATRAPLADVLPDEVGIFEDYTANRPRSYGPGTYIGNGLELDGDPLTEVAFSGDEVRTTIQAGGRRFNPVEGATCSGYVSPQPTAVVETGGGDVAFAASGADLGVDLTMVVRTPGGDFLCSDDSDGTDPAIWVSGGADGAYTLWVGSFTRRDEAVDATLVINDTPIDPPAPPRPVAPPPPPEPIRE
ncbi:MAG: hypothetical protein AAFQ43_00155 [Bacteroidota bacterium]